MTIMTIKPFDQLAVGDVICDMHDGIQPLRKRFDVRIVVRWDHDDNHAPFSKRCNKMLEVLGVNRDNPYEILAGYSYDGRMSAILGLSEAHHVKA